MLTPFVHSSNRLPFAATTPGNPMMNQSRLSPGNLQKMPPGANIATHGAPDLPRGLNFYADYSGCGHWRMIWPELLLNCYAKANVQGGTVMIGDKNFYKDVQAVRIQRQATEPQLRYIKWLKQLQPEMGFKLIYEIDDIVFKEDIPHYNKFRFAFEDPKIRQTCMEIMKICDEITVTNKFMKDYYIEKTGNPNVTIIPNFIPRFWMDRYYDLNKIKDAYLNTILQVKEDMLVLKAYIKQTRDFQKWAVKQTLKEK